MDRKHTYRAAHADFAREVRHSERCGCNTTDWPSDTTVSPLAARRSWIFVALLSALFLTGIATPKAFAQGSGEITGTVTDPTGAVVPGASVTLLDVGTGVAHTAKSNSAGLFDFTALDVGKYNLSVKMTGFSAFQKNNILMNVAQTLREDVPLAAGAESQTVTVEANALQVQSETNEMSTLITGQQMVQLATNGRNVTSLTSLGTGVSGNLPTFNGVTAQGSDADLSFNGMRPDHNNWLIDGGEVYDRGSGGKLDVMPSPDVLAEFNVLASNYTPDYGISSGGTVSMVLKSGTKSFHGGAWEFVRNDDFDANNYFTKQAGQPNPELRLNIFGGDIGGPVWIPHLYNQNKDKTFFFYSEEWRRYIQGAQPSTQNTVPLGDFPVAGQALTYVPLAKEAAPIVPVTSDPVKAQEFAADGEVQGQPFKNNVIPANLLDPNAVLFMNTGAIPKPNFGTDQYVASPKQPTYVREDVVRIDQIFTSKYHLLGSWIHDAMSQTIIPTQWSGDSYSTVGDVFSNPSWAAVIKLSQTLSPTLLNETALNVNGNTISVVPTGIYAQPSGYNAGSFFTGNNALNRLPQVQFSNGPLNTTYTAIYWPWHNSFLNYQVRDDLSKIWGRHSIKVGAAYMRDDKNQQLQADTEGDYLFNGQNFSGNSYVNFLLGFASTYEQLQAQRTDHYVNNTYSAYVNDDWHATQRLTLNIGLRYDALPHVYEKNNQLGNFNPAAFNPADANVPNASTDALNSNGPGLGVVNGQTYYLNGIQIAGTNGVPRQLVNNDYLTVQPRVGFALDLFGNGKTVLRAGAGLFYERVQGNDTYNIDTTPPFAYEPKISNVYFSSPTTSDTSGQTATAPLAPATLTNESVYYPNPATAQYSFSIQNEIAPSIITSLGYVGTVGWSQDDKREINDLTLSAPYYEREAVALSSTVCSSNGAVGAATCAGTNYAGQPDVYRQFPGFSNVSQEENAQNFSYNSLQASLRMEAKHGLSAQFSYTWSHEIDIQSTDLTTLTLQGSGGDLSDPYNARYDRGSGAFDRRNIFNANYIYSLPFFLHSSNGFAREALGGWQIAGITTAESGSPVNIYYNGFNTPTPAPGYTTPYSDTLGLGGDTTNRPNISGVVTFPKTQKAWFSTSPFTAPVAPWQDGGTTTGFGNASKDTIHGPGLFNWNISLYKEFRLTPHEGGPRLQLRAESYNTFNHTEFQTIDTGTSDTNFGQVTAAYDPRELQFGAKFLF